jgi:peptidoglycan/LPS O-acetylase OafA/YrhL
MPTPTTRSARWPALDGLRALAVVAVIGYHLSYAGLGFPGGYTGVNVFFVLSGFLITSLLVQEFESFGGIDFAAFWMRRAIRLAPALLVTIVAAAALAALDVSSAQPHETLVGIPWVLLYVGNYARVFNQDALGVLGHTWSLAVEEQFYLVWPPLFLLLAAKRSKLAWKVLAVLAILDVVWGQIATVAYGEARGNFGTDTNCYSLLSGCALGLWYMGRRNVLRPPTRSGATIWQGLSALAVVGAIVVMAAVAETTYSMTPQTAAVTLCTLIVLGQILLAPGGPVQALLECAPARWVGRRSYGFYLYHYVILTVWTTQAHGLALDVVKVGKIAATTIVVALSWRYLEQPVQQRFRPRWQRSVLPPEDPGLAPITGIQLHAP